MEGNNKKDLATKLPKGKTSARLADKNYQQWQKTKQQKEGGEKEKD